MNLIYLISFFSIFGNATSSWAIDNCKQTFAVIGDYGDGGAGEKVVANLVKTWNVDAIVTTGDNNYENGSAATIDNHIGQFYSEFIFPYKGTYKLSGVEKNRFFPSLGNHDWDDGPRAYYDYFPSPIGNRYYEVAIGPAHFFILNSNVGEPDGLLENGTQAIWLKEKLKISKAPFKIVVFHHPPYTSISDHGPDLKMRWPFKEWGATVVLNGHNHFYERLEVDGFKYLVNGTGGHSFYKVKNRAKESKLLVLSEYGAQRIITSCTEMEIQFINVKGEIKDRVRFMAIP